MLDIVKHKAFFDPLSISGSKILVVGAGATGSATALSLAKLGLTDITVMDFDTVEGHNLPNQYAYGPDQIGWTKVNALRQTIKQLTGTEIKTLVQSAGTEKLYYDYVFVCVDSMSARMEILQCCYMNGCTKFYGETRMGATNGAAYAFNILDFKQVRDYKETLYPDSEVAPEVGNCGTVLSIGATAQLVSAYLVFMFMQFAKKDLRYNELLFDLPSGEVSKRPFACVDPSLL